MFSMFDGDFFKHFGALLGPLLFTWVIQLLLPVM
jgi:hypothetical protein